MPEESLLTRTLTLGNTGKDVEAIKRSVYRSLNNGKLKTLKDKPTWVRRRFGVFFLLDVYAVRRKLQFARKPTIDQALWKRLVTEGAPDALAYDLLQQHIDEQKPKLIEPRQGFSSLHRSLWEAYALGRSMGLSDLGTYNPNSNLPSGGPSDHAVFPAYAFDLGFSPQIGYNHPTARRFFNLMVGRGEVGYVILGTKIWSRARASEGVRYYGSGGHEGHAHVSGRR